MSKASPTPAGTVPVREPLRGPGAGVWAALAVVYVVWGSTYLAIRVVVEDMPSLLACGVRFLIAGALLLAYVRVARGPDAVRVTRAQVRGAAIVGVLLVAGGNGVVFVAERDVPSNLAALIIACVPLVIVAIRALMGERTTPRALLGVAIGFIGVGILLAPGRPAGATVVGCVLVLVAAVSWAVGSIASRRIQLPADALASTSVQMLAGGAVAMAGGLVTGEGFGEFAFTLEGVAAFVYLVTIGSILAFSAYVWLLRNAPIQLVSTYAYVNPVIAVVLGWAILGEELSLLAIAASAVIVASVALIVREEAPAPGREPRSVRRRVAAAGAVARAPEAT